jgi:extradiol dioxygenase family protein
MPRPFHLAFVVEDLRVARRFYAEVLGCKEGRSAERWVDLDFFGHQLSLHLGQAPQARSTNPVDGDAVPLPHFGVILAWSQWKSLADRLQTAGMDFVIPPRIRFEGEMGEQATLFFRDPSGNALEFKSFRRDDSIFAG